MENKLTEFASIRIAVEEHLQAINENSLEIQALFDYLQAMDEKIEKISARLDNLQLEQNQRALKCSSLTEIEKEIFLVLYTAEMPLGSEEISKRTGLSKAITIEYLRTIGEKGIPLVRSLGEKKVLVALESKFKERQAKENLINLSLDSFLKK